MKNIVEMHEYNSVAWHQWTVLVALSLLVGAVISGMNGGGFDLQGLGSTLGAGIGIMLWVVLATSLPSFIYKISTKKKMPNYQWMVRATWVLFVVLALLQNSSIG